jgi:glyoxylase-like metal-dependent hydrolase (beta-lactamase superfamily II)
MSLQQRPAGSFGLSTNELDSSAGHSVQGYDPSGAARQIAEGVYSLSQRMGGHVHAFLLDDSESLTLIDTLFDTDGARIIRAIKRMGRSISDLRNIVITHGHRSHIGGLAALKKLSGAKVWAHQYESDIIAGERKAQGVTAVPKWPLKVYPIQLGLALHIDGHAPCEVDAFACEGDRIGPVEVIHAPGHSPGHLGFYWRERRTLFAGDALATWPAPSLGWPGLTLNPTQSLKSLRKMDDVSADIIAVGHGEPAIGEKIEILRQLVRSGRIHL